MNRNRRPPKTTVRRALPPGLTGPTSPARLADLHARYRPETLALAAAYLRAFGSGDTAAADGLLAGSDPTELIAGLTVLSCVLADDLGATDGTGTTAVLELTWRRCTAHHRAAIGLA